MRYRLLCLAVFTIFVGIAAPASAQYQTVVDPALAEKGMKLFTAQKCSLCHSVAGKGNPKGALDEVGLTLSADELRLWLVNPQQMRDKTHAERKPIMKAFATLPKGDLDALVAYLQTLKKKT